MRQVLRRLGRWQRGFFRAHGGRVAIFVRGESVWTCVMERRVHRRGRRDRVAYYYSPVPAHLAGRRPPKVRAFDDIPF